MRLIAGFVKESFFRHQIRPNYAIVSKLNIVTARQALAKLYKITNGHTG
jgi:hypothetical protein